MANPTMRKFLEPIQSDPLHPAPVTRHCAKFLRGFTLVLPFFGIWAFVLFCVGPVSAQETLRQYLSGADAEHPVAWDFFCSAGRNSGVWTNIAVPSCWELQGFGQFRYGHEDKKYTPIQATYRHRFQVPEDWRGRRVFIVFDGVMTDAAVKVNGVEAGSLHQGAFYRFKYDITDRIKYGAENTLEVAVTDQSADASVNRAERQADYWVFGGIFRPVWLQAEPAQFVERVAIDARADGSFALDFFLGGTGSADAVEVILLDAQGHQVGGPATTSVSAGHLTTRVASPALWSAETPALYTAVVRLKQGATVVHQLKQRFGFRTVAARAGDGVYVNGHRVMFRGVCHHVAWPTLGRASSPRIAALDLDLIQEMNMNAVRMSHYPPDEEFLEMCDQRGLYVLDELTGWQKQYDTDIGRQHVQELVTRDVNHPSIVIWDNGNEGGWNTNLDGDFLKLDPQQRAVIHPWAKFGLFDTKHYPDFKTLTGLLASNLIVMPTEFLHGLYDGGLGAGLEDYWAAMCASKNSAGGFLWVFADEGVQRADLHNTIDVKGNWAPDGIVGPFRQKEASFYAIKQIWSPVQLPRTLPADFEGTLPVENRYEVTSLTQCQFVWKLARFGSAPGAEILAEGRQAGPEVAPGQTGKLLLHLPEDWKQQPADALAVTALNAGGHELYTWVWPLRSPGHYAPTGHPLAGVTNAGELRLQAADTIARIDPANGRLLEVTAGGQKFSLTSESLPQAQWSMLDSGWLKLEYAVDPAVQTNVVGVAFDYPEAKMVKKTWLGDGPYRLWRNRRAGNALGVWETAFNQTATGFTDWIYPEFSGYFSGVRWLRLTTTEGVITLVIPDENKFVRVGTPVFPENQLMAKMAMSFPPGNLAVLGDVPPIGNKFHTADRTGPQAVTPLVRAPYRGTVYFRFEARPTRPAKD